MIQTEILYYSFFLEADSRRSPCPCPLPCGCGQWSPTLLSSTRGRAPSRDLTSSAQDQSAQLLSNQNPSSTCHIPNRPRKRKRKMKMKVVALVSGGKDSCFAMMRSIDYGHQVGIPLILIPVTYLLPPHFYLLHFLSSSFHRSLPLLI